MSDWRRPDLPVRDAALDAAWSAHSTELPPEGIDAAILAAARRETHTRPRAIRDDDAGTHARRPPRAWWGLAAAAAIGVIAFGVVQLAPPPVDKSETMVATDIPVAPRDAAPSAPATDPYAQHAAPASAPAASAPPAFAAYSSADANAPPRPAPKVAKAAPDSPPRDAPAASPAARQTTDPQRALAEREPQPSGAEPPRLQGGATPRTAQTPRERVAAMAPPAPAAPPSSAPRPFPAPASPNAGEAAPPPTASRAEPPAALAPKTEASNAFAEGRDTARAPAAAMPPAQSAAGASAAAPRDAGSQPLAKQRPLSPDAWIARIRTLYGQRRLNEAARELNAFRDAYPDADQQLPPMLAAWAADVKRNTP